MIVMASVVYLWSAGRTIGDNGAVRVVQALCWLADMVLDDNVEPVVDEVLNHVYESAGQPHQTSSHSQV